MKIRPQRLDLFLQGVEMFASGRRIPHAGTGDHESDRIDEPVTAEQEADKADPARCLGKADSDEGGSLLGAGERLRR